MKPSHNGFVQPFLPLCSTITMVKSPWVYLSRYCLKSTCIHYAKFTYPLCKSWKLLYYEMCWVQTHSISLCVQIFYLNLFLSHLTELTQILINTFFGTMAYPIGSIYTSLATLLFNSRTLKHVVWFELVQRLDTK